MSSSHQDGVPEATTRLRIPLGFRFSGVACGIKPSGKPDVSLILCDRGVTTVGVYTQNQIVAAPVLLCRERTPSTKIRAVITNSGNANACTGDAGMRDAEEMCERVASRIGCEPCEVLVMSTGVIGVSMPMESVRSGIDDAFENAASGADAFMAAAEAICTTDKSRKTVSQTVDCDGESYTVAAMAKGAGMIAPNMATMLGVILTDAPLSPESAQQVLTDAAAKSFNRVSVDGHTSTNDTLLLLSSGQGEPLSGDQLRSFTGHVTALSIDLAKKLVADGEGASHVMAIRVLGAENDQAAETIAKTVAASPLVKTAITGADPNWGRIVSAAGYAEAKIKPKLTSLRICDTTIYDHGSPKAYDEATLSGEMKRSPEVAIELTVGDGDGEAEYWSSDLTTDYVRFNSEYTT